MKSTKLTRSLLLTLSLTMAVNTTKSMESNTESWMTTGIALVGGILLGKIALNILWQQPETFPFSDLQKDIQNTIFNLIISGSTSNTLEEAATSIRNLTLVNKELNTLINDSAYSEQLINHLVQKFNQNVDVVCKTLNTEGALTYLAQQQAQLQDEFHTTPLMMILSKTPDTIKKNYKYVLKLITESKDYINKQDLDGRTPLLIVLTQAIANLIRNPNFNQRYIPYLIELRNIEHRKEIYKLYRPIIRLLLQYGADPELANNHGATPLQMAMRLQDEEIISMIRDAITKKHGM